MRPKMLCFRITRPNVFLLYCSSAGLPPRKFSHGPQHVSYKCLTYICIAYTISNAHTSRILCSIRGRTAVCEPSQILKKDCTTMTLRSSTPQRTDVEIHVTIRTDLRSRSAKTTSLTLRNNIFSSARSFAVVCVRIRRRAAFVPPIHPRAKHNNIRRVGFVTRFPRTRRRNDRRPAGAHSPFYSSYRERDVFFYGRLITTHYAHYLYRRKATGFAITRRESTAALSDVACHRHTNV